MVVEEGAQAPRRRTALMRQSGPYRVYSHADGKLTIYPAWSQYKKWTAEDGGGPGMPTRLALAAELQDWLNAPFHNESVLAWVQRYQEKFEEVHEGLEKHG